MASEAGMKQLYLVGNRVMNDAQKAAIQSFADKNGLQVLAFIPFDTNITDSDMLGKTPLLNKEIPSVKTIDNICELLLKKTESTAYGDNFKNENFSHSWPWRYRKIKLYCIDDQMFHRRRKITYTAC
jgi:nitrogenase subunit NifH